MDIRHHCGYELAERKSDLETLPILKYSKLARIVDAKNVVRGEVTKRVFIRKTHEISPGATWQEDTIVPEVT